MGKKDNKCPLRSEKSDPCAPTPKEDPCKIEKSDPCKIEKSDPCKIDKPSPCEAPKKAPIKALGSMSPKDLWKSLSEIKNQERIQQLRTQLEDMVKKSPDYFKSQLKKVNKENIICLVKCSRKYIKEFGTMADKPVVGRPMKFPYTFSAKFAQFPLKYYINNQWIWKYYFISLAVCMPVFYSINKLANSPGNVSKWAEIRRKEAAEHH